MNRRIQAIILNTTRGYVFTPAFFILLLIVLSIPWWSSSMAGDGTAEGKFKVFITYSFLLTSIILSVANIGFSSLAISSEWKKKTLFLLDAKPVRRWEIISGKWCGILLTNFFLLIAFVLSMGLFSLRVSHSTTKNFPETRNLFLTYRQVYPLSSKESAVETSKPISAPESKPAAPSVSSRETYPVPPHAQREWIFRGIKTAETEKVYLLYRFRTSKDDKQTNVVGYWLVGPPATKNPYELVTQATQAKVHRIQLPTGSISKEGDINITYSNVDSRNISILFPKKDLKIIYPQGNYWVNLLAGTVNLFLLVGFISALGLLFSCLVSSMTAVISTSALVFIAYLHDFVRIVANSLIAKPGAQEAVAVSHRISHVVLKSTLMLLPPLNQALPHTFIGDFLLLPPQYLLFLFLRIIVFGAFPLLIIAMIYFSRRELGVPNE